MNLTEFIKGRNVKINAVSNYISRHEEEFKGHIKKNGNSSELDEVAIDLLEKKYPLEKLVQVINGVDPQELIDALNELAEAKEMVIKIQKAYQERTELIAQAEATKLLLEDKEKQLQEKEKRLLDAESEIERLRKRNLIDRIFNN